MEGSMEGLMEGSVEGSMEGLMEGSMEGSMEAVPAVQPEYSCITQDTHRPVRHTPRTSQGSTDLSDVYAYVAGLSG